MGSHDNNRSGFAPLARNMPALTGIRGWAALWVLLFHVNSFDRFRVPGIASGYLGVDAFFILSGFVLSHGYATRFAQPTKLAWVRFLRGRVARIYPLHLLMLSVSLIVVLALPQFSAARTAGRFSAQALLACMLLIQNWGAVLPESWNSPTWSLSAEWCAYLVFPVMAAFVLRLRSGRTSLLFAFGCWILLTAAFLLLGKRSLDSMGSAGMIRMAFEFTAGSLLWRAAFLGWRLPRQATFWAAAMLLFGAILPGATFLALPAFAMFVLLGASEEGAAHRLLAQPISIWLGEISYSVYLIHFIPLDLLHWAVKPVVPGWAWIMCQLAFILMVLAASSGMYRWFELPAKRLLSAGSAPLARAS